MFLRCLRRWRREVPSRSTVRACVHERERVRMSERRRQRESEVDTQREI